MAESHLAQTGLESKPRELGFYKDTLPRPLSPGTSPRFPLMMLPEAQRCSCHFPSELFPAPLLLLREPGSQVDGESRCSRVRTLRTPSPGRSPPHLRLSTLPTLLPAPGAPRLPYLLCTLRAQRPAPPPPPPSRSGLLVPRQEPGRARARAGPARSRGAHRRGRGRASRCGLAPLSGSFPLSFSFSRPRLLQFVKDPPEPVAVAGTRVG